MHVPSTTITAHHDRNFRLGVLAHSIHGRPTFPVIGRWRSRLDLPIHIPSRAAVPFVRPILQKDGRKRTNCEDSLDDCDHGFLSRPYYGPPRLCVLSVRMLRALKNVSRYRRDLRIFAVDSSYSGVRSLPTSIILAAPTGTSNPHAQVSYRWHCARSIPCNRGVQGRVGKKRL